MTSTDVLARDRLPKAFTPTRPIDLPELLYGRRNLLYRLQDDVMTPGNHVLLYGDRGVGKTSIARVLGYMMQEPEEPHGLRSILLSCDTFDSFGTIWRKVFQEILLAERQLGFSQYEGRSIVGRWNPEDDVIEAPNDVRLLMGALPNPTVVIIDEFDRVQDPDTRLRMTDTIKLFSDTDTPCSIILVGVGQSIDDLVTAHESISRNLDYVHVEPMTLGELVEIIQQGFSLANMQFVEGLDFRIANLSQGYPHYTHLLGLWSGRKAADRGSRLVDWIDLQRAIPNSIENAMGSIRLEYERATDSPQPNNLFKQVLLACAMADKDVRGRFRLTDVRSPLQSILGRSINPISYQRHLSAFCDEDRGPTLIKTGRRRNYRWHFANPQLIPFVRLQGIKDGFISDEIVG